MAGVLLVSGFLIWFGLVWLLVGLFYGLQVKAGNSGPRLCSHETPAGELNPALGCPAREGHQ